MKKLLTERLIEELGVPDAYAALAIIEDVLDLSGLQKIGPLEDTSAPPTFRGRLEDVEMRMQALEKRSSIIREWNSDQDRVGELRQSKIASAIFDLSDRIRKLERQQH